jgi:thiosulfate dehydrogenase [quinone] large subunit
LTRGILEKKSEGEKPSCKETNVSVNNSQGLVMNATGASEVQLASTISNEASSGRVLGYLVLRLCLGLNLMVHGIARIFFGNFQPYVAFFMKGFVGGPLPLGLVREFLVVLPFVELLLGLLVLIGLATRYSLLACGLVMFFLLFGTCLMQNWNAAQIQMLYTFLITYMLMNIEWNRWSLDRLLQPAK